MTNLIEAQADADSGAETDAVLSRADALPAARPSGDTLRELARDIMEAQALTQSEAATQIGRSASALNQWLQNKYKGDVAAFEADVVKWVARNADSAALGNSAGSEPPFAETPSAKAYIATLRYAQTMGKFGVIYGESGNGKTRAIVRYAAIRPNVFVCTAAPSDRTLYPFLKRLARAVRVSNPGTGPAEITDSIIDKVAPARGLIVVDEADWLDIVPIEQLRYIHDRTGIGVVLAGNDEVYAQLTGGTRKPALARLYSRVGKRQRASCLPADVEAIARGMGVESREEIAYLKEIARRPGHLRNVVQVVQQGAIRAAGKSEKLTRDHLELAWTNLGAEV